MIKRLTVTNSCRDFNLKPLECDIRDDCPRKLGSGQHGPFYSTAGPFEQHMKQYEPTGISMVISKIT